MIDKSGLRAKQDETAVYLIEPGDYSFLEFDSFYITRVSALFSRIKMFETTKMDYNMFIDTKELDNGDKIVTTLVLKSDSTKASFGCCTLPQKARMPKKVNDPTLVDFTVDKKSIDVLKRGVSAMGGEFVTLYNDGDKIYAKVRDIEGDTLTHTISEDYNISLPDVDDFSFEYEFKVAIPLLWESAREHEEFRIRLTRRGIMGLNINGLNMYIFAEA
jgi:hypothetical protein